MKLMLVRFKPHYLITLVLIISLAMLGFYIFKGYIVYFHSDAAAVNLLAEEIAKTGQFFPHDWTYVNKDLWVIQGQLPIALLIPYVKNNFYLHGVASAITAIMVLVGAWLLLKELDVNVIPRRLFLAIIATGISPYFAENLYGQASYGVPVFVSLFLLIFYLRSTKATGIASISWLMALAFVFALACLGNPARALATYGLPLMCTGSFVYITRKNINYSSFVIRPVAAMLVGTLLGISAHYWALQITNNVMGAAAAHYIDISDYVRHLTYFFIGLFYLLGGVPEAGKDVVSSVGILFAVKFMVAMAIMFLMFEKNFWISLLFKKSSALNIVAGFSLSSLLLIAFFFMVTSVPDLTNQSSAIVSSRYFVVGVFAFLLAAYVYGINMVWQIHEKRLRWLCLSCISALILSLGFINLVLPWIQYRGPIIEKGITGDRAQLSSLLDHLREEGLVYGYSGYWDAGVSTVLSGGEIKSRQILIESGLPVPFRHLSSNAWYRSSEYSGRTFLMTNKDMELKLDQDSLANYLGNPQKIINVDETKIRVYSFNIAEKLPGWDDTLERPIRILINKQTRHTTGEIIKDEEGGMQVLAERGHGGYLIFGQYYQLVKGNYEVVFDIQGEKDSKVKLDVVANMSTELSVKDVSLSTNWQKIVVSFSALDRAKHEFRVYTDGSNEVRVRLIELKKAE